jgi:tripartite motif-containing protein 71
MRQVRVGVAATSAALVVSALFSGGQAHAAPALTVSFLKTLAGPSLAPMYPSGLIWDAGNPLCTHSTGCIVLADTGYNRIAVFDPNSPTAATPVLTFGSLGTGDGQFNTPRDAAVDAAHNIYVVDAANSRLQAFDMHGNHLWTAWGPGKLAGDLNTPIGITYDQVNNQLIVADTGHSEVKGYSPSNGAFLWKSPTGLLLQPRDAKRGPDGDVWVADYEHQVVRAFKVNPTTGVWNTAWDVQLGDGAKGGHGNGQLNFPYNVSFSPDGKTAYVADTGNERIARWDISGSTPVWLTQFGIKCNSTPSGCPDNQFLALRRVTVDPSTGNVWAADFWGSGIHEFFPSGSTTGAIEIDGNPAPVPGFGEAFGITVAPDGTTYGVDRLNQRVESFDAGGTFLHNVGSRGVSAGKFSWPETAAAAPDGTVWVGDTRNDRLQQFAATLPSSKPLLVVGTSGSGVGQFNRIDGVAVDAAGVVWIADQVNNRIQSYNPSTKTFKVFPAAVAISQPDGVAVSSTNVYVADTNNNRVVEFTKGTGAFVGEFDGLNQPQGVALAPDGTLWVADTFNNQILHLSSSLANLNDTFGCSDGGACNANQQFFQPHSLALSPNGSVLFVADTFNNRVQEFSLS